jgi:hypothetical protein
MSIRFKALLLTLFFFITLNCSYLQSYSAVTYRNTPGRFGDCLIAYLQAKWISYKYNLPLVYKSFNYFSELIIEEKEKENSPTGITFKATFPVNKLIQQTQLNSTLPTLYRCTFFPESKFELEQKKKKYNFSPPFKVDWKDKKFRSIINELVAPKNEIETINIPENCISLAIHYREGGGFDPKRTAHRIPHKMPPIIFYVKALIKVLEYFEDETIFCYVFTDAKDSSTTETFIEELKKNIEYKGKITFDYRKENNSWKSNVLEDFFSFFNFDVFIRSDSNFSLVASLIHDFPMIASPNMYFDANNKLIFDVHIDINN